MGKKTLTKGRVGVYIALQPYITTWLHGQKERKAERKLKLN